MLKMLNGFASGVPTKGTPTKENILSNIIHFQTNRHARHTIAMIPQTPSSGEVWETS